MTLPTVIVMAASIASIVMTMCAGESMFQIEVSGVLPTSDRIQMSETKPAVFGTKARKADTPVAAPWYTSAV